MAQSESAVVLGGGQEGCVVIQFCDGPGDETVLLSGGAGCSGPVAPARGEQGEEMVCGLRCPTKCHMPGGGSVS